MRIGLIIYGSLDTLSGGYLYDRMLVRQLVGFGCQLQLLSLTYDGYAKNLTHNWDRSWQHRLANAQLDLLIQDELNHPSLLAANRRPRPYPVVSLVHHLRSSELDHGPLLTTLYRQVERIYLNSVDAFLCNSQTTLRSVELLLHRPRPSFIAYPAADHLPLSEPAIDLPALAARSRQEGPLRILFVGNLIRRKGLHTVLDALAQLPANSWQLSIVGRMDIDVDYTKKMRLRTQSLPSSAVTFHGRLSDAQLAAQYRSHHLFVLPSYEGFGIVYLEAMRFGLPVIAAATGAAHEIVTHGENGFLVAPGDAAALAEHIRHLHANREQLLAMSHAARRRYTQHPTWQQSMANAAAWLTSLSQGNK